MPVRNTSKAVASPDHRSASDQIDAIIETTHDWRGEMLSRLRALIQSADPALVEEVKWKKPSNPAGIPVWSHNGIVCMANTLKHAVRLTFPKGTLMKDPSMLFNTRLDSKTVRAIDFHADDAVDEEYFKALVVQAMELNTSTARNQ